MKTLHDTAMKYDFKNRFIILVLPVSTLLILSIFYFSITYNDFVVGFLSDDATYLLMAEMYSPWVKGTSPLLEFLRYDFQFPPLYPLLLAIMGVTSTTPETASLVTTGFLLLSFVIIGIWGWVETKNSVLAVMIPVIFALLPSSILFSQDLLSEFLFICFLYAAFACLAGKDLNDRHWLFAALMIGFASLTRTIGISIIVAYAILLFFNRPKKSFIFFIVSALPLVSWNLFRLLIASEHVYWEIISGQFTGTSIVGLLKFIAQQIVILGESWFWLFSVFNDAEIYHFISVVVASLFFVIFLYSFFIRFRLKKFDAFCIPVYLGIIVLWPFTGVHFVSRFLYPLLPLIIFYNIYGIILLAKTKIRKRLGIGIYLLLLITMAAPANYQFVKRAYLTIDTELMPYRRSRSWLLASSDEQAIHEAVYTREFFQVLRKISDKIPANECIFTFQTPVVMLYTNRIAGSLPAPDVSDDVFEQKISACRFIFATYLADSNGIYPRFYPLKRLEGNKNYEILPFYPEHAGYSEPVAFLIERISNQL